MLALRQTPSFITSEHRFVVMKPQNSLENLLLCLRQTIRLLLIRIDFVMLKDRVICDVTGGNGAKCVEFVKGQ